MITLNKSEQATIKRLKKLTKKERDVIYYILGDLELNGDPHELVMHRATFNRLIKCFRAINCPTAQGLEITTFVDQNDAEFIYEQEDEDVLKEMEELKKKGKL
jgi:hypothetical protein